MKLSIKGLKSAFEAGCNRAKNLSLGTSYFQDFEIAHFLNNAYMVCVQRRLSHNDERYVSVAHKQGIPPHSAFPNSPLAVIEFGSLYGASTMVPQSTTPYSVVEGATVKEETAGGNTRFFKIDDVNSFKPYIMNVQLFEYSNNKKGIVAAFVCKPVNVSDVPRLALVYQSDKFANYLFYRERKVATKDSTKTVTMANYIEIVYTPRMGGQKLHVSYDYISIPKEITEVEVRTEDARQIEVLFGYEVVTTAVQIAMESIGTSRGSISTEQREIAAS